MLLRLPQASVSDVWNGNGTSHCRTSYSAETETMHAQSKLVRETSQVTVLQLVLGLAGLD